MVRPIAKLIGRASLECLVDPDPLMSDGGTHEALPYGCPATERRANLRLLRRHVPKEAPKDARTDRSSLIFHFRSLSRRSQSHRRIHS